MVLSEVRVVESANDTVKKGRRVVPVPGATVRTMPGWPGKVVQETVGLIRRASSDSDQTGVENLRSLAIEANRGQGLSGPVSTDTYARIRKIEDAASKTTNEVERARLLRDRETLKEALICGTLWN